MELDNKEQEAIRQYLLGQVRQEDLPQLEELLLTDSAFYEELLIAEDELIDQYLRDGLSQPERESFETHFLLAPERQQKVRFGRAFDKYVSAVDPLPDEDPAAAGASEAARDVPKPPLKKPFFSFLPFRNPILPYSLAAALVLLVGTVSWLALKNWQPSGSHDPGKVIALSLTPGLTRSDDGSDIKRISVAPDVGTLQMRLQLTRDDYTSYRATLVLDGQTEVWTADHLPALNEASIKVISADIPARLLTPGDYQVKLAGQPANGSLEDIASYSFRVTR